MVQIRFGLVKLDELRPWFYEAVLRGFWGLIIGVPTEIKMHEHRVAVTPAGAALFAAAGHHILVQQAAGDGSGFSDDEYRAHGAEIVAGPAEIFERAEMVMKVKEPLPAEYDLFQPGQLLFTYLHLAAEPALTQVLIDRQVCGVAYETVQAPDRSLPLLTPMSEVAGRMAPQIGAHLLEKLQGGRGILLSGVPGVPPGDVVIVGGGVVGTQAAKIALGLGARVTMIDINADRLRFLDDLFRGEVVTVMSNPVNIAAAVERADLLIGAVLIPGARAPNLVSEEMVKTMKPGSVIIDVAIDQGGSIATCDRVTTHADPVYVKHGVLHYAVANMPGAVPRTSTLGLTNVTMPYALALADKGFEAAVRGSGPLALGVNTYQGHVTYQAVADAHHLDYTPLDSLVDLRR